MDRLYPRSRCCLRKLSGGQSRALIIRVGSLFKGSIGATIRDPSGYCNRKTANTSAHTGLNCSIVFSFEGARNNAIYPQISGLVLGVCGLRFQVFVRLRRLVGFSWAVMSRAEGLGLWVRQSVECEKVQILKGLP